MKPFKLKNIIAFTLVEVLITLTIIGVVSVITMGVLQQYQKNQYTTALKKAYSQFNQILQQMATDNGTIGDISDYFGTTASAGATIASYYKVTKNCGTTTGDECFAKFDDNYDGSARSTTTWTGGVNANYKFITADGASLSIYSFGDNCVQNRGFSATPNSPTYNSTCGYIYIDANGLKKPNSYGRDVFAFFITNKKTPSLYPQGGFYVSLTNTGTTTNGGSYYWNYQGTSNRCSSSNKNGTYCAGRLIEKNWEMDY